MIASLLALGIFAACAEEEDNTPGETSGIVDGTEDINDTPSNVDANGYLLDNVPTDTLNYGDRTITMLTWSDVEHEEFQSSGQTGDIINDAIFLRNLAVEDRLGIRLSFHSTPGNAQNVAAYVRTVQTSVESGDKSFDLIASYSLSMAATANAGYCYNLLEPECEYLDFDMPWWPDRLISEATINNKLFFASGDISANALYMMYVCYVNNDIVETLALPNVFELVDSNQWTYDKFIEMCSGVYSDNNGNGIKDVNDQFGYMSSGIHVDPWFYGSGALIVDKDENGSLRFSPSFGSEKVIKSLEMVNGLLFNTNDGMYTSKVLHQDQFNQGNLLFASDRARIAITKLVSESLSFSVVPFPKFDSNQENFVTVMGNPFTLYAIPIDVKDTDLPMLSAIIEVYASESYRKLTPALYEITLKTKYVQEADSARMYDIVRENLTFDLGRIFSSVLIGQGHFRNAVSGNQASGWANITRANQKILAAKLDQLTAAFED